VVAGTCVYYFTEHSSAQQAPRRFPLFVRGYIAATVFSRSQTLFEGSRGAHDVFLPGIKVFLRNAGTNVESGTAETDLSGRFTLRPPVPGRYRVCWKSKGFIDDCSKDIYSVSSGPVHTSTIRIEPDRREKTTVVFGNVKMKDGKIPRTFEPLAGINAFARVALLDGSGNRLQVVPVNNFGEYLLPQVPPQQKIAIRAEIESGVKEQRLLPQANLNGAPFHPINLVIGNTPPHLEPLVPTDSNGRRVKTSKPGKNVVLKANGSDADGDALKYKWIVSPGSGVLSATDHPTVTWKLPASPGRYSVALLVSDDKGGYTRTELSLRVDERGIPFSGKVDATDAAAVPGARVEVNGQVASTNPDGSFSIFVRDADRFVLNIHKPGYALVSRIYDDAVTGGRWTMTRASVMTVDPNKQLTLVDRRDGRNCPGPRASYLDWRSFPQLAQPQWQDGKGNVIAPPKEGLRVLPAYFLNLPNPGNIYQTPNNQKQCGPGLQVEIPADALRDSRGRRATGNVEIALSTVDLLSPEQMPGDYTVRLPGGATKVMQSYGAGTVEITSGGQRFNLKPGTTAKVTIPVDPSQLATGAPLPPTIPLLFYNERDGVWEQEGTATLQGNAYVANVKHFSAINTDQVKTNQSCVEIDSPTLPPTYKLEYTIPQPGSPGAAPIVRNATIDNSAPSIHVIYNLPSATNIVLVPIRDDTNVPIGTFVVNTGGPQNPTNPNLPALTAAGYTACSTKVVLSDQAVPDEPLNGYEFLHGLYSFEAVNLTELQGTDPVFAAQYDTATANYYTQVDPRGKRTTLAGFKSTNNFPTAEVNVKFVNSGDLGFGRDMHCAKKANASLGGFDVACYVTNYGNINTPDSDDILATVAGTNPVATVAMEFSQVESAPGNPTEFDDPERVVKFFVYSADGTQLLKAANLDGVGARPIPQLCMVCHNGEYPGGAVPSGTPPFNSRADVKLGSRFLPFDLHFYTFTGAPFDKASQQANFKSLNEDFVRLTDTQDPTSISASTDIKTIVDGMYAGGPAQDENFITAGWNATPLDRGMYRDVVARTCRTCHSANVVPSLTFDQTSEMRNLLSATEIRVCDDYVMPHAKVTNRLFWLSVGPHMPAQLQAFGDSVAASTPGTGWTGQRCGVFTPGGATPASPYDPIQAIFDANCTTCHSGGSPPQGLNLAAGVSYLPNLFNVNSNQAAGVKRVKPNDPDNSYLWRKVDGSQAAVGGSGSRMPQGQPQLSQADRDTIRNWILAGAPGP
jgi:cytochrome c5